LANDCDDWNAMINPSAMEICDWIDNNCTGSADEGLPMTTYYRDYDYDQREPDHFFLPLFFSVHFISSE